MSLTTDREDPNLKKTRLDGQMETYLVLSEEERQKGFVRPVRQSYRHVGERPKYPVRELTEEEHERYDKFGYLYYEAYPENSGETGGGMFWTDKRIRSGCGTVTKMGSALSETYARDPKFYGSTFCCNCGAHFPVNEFVWDGTNERVGS